MVKAQVTVLDYGAGNIGSVLNALKAVGVQEIIMVKEASDIQNAEVTMSSLLFLSLKDVDFSWSRIFWCCNIFAPFERILRTSAKIFGIWQAIFWYMRWYASFV
jgi:hypothetical protein